MSTGIAIILAGALALAGGAAGWLTAGGAVAAGVIGAAIFAGGGLTGASLLALFFVSGSLLTRAASGSPPARTAQQVIANGVWAAAGALLVFVSDAGWPLMAGALAAAQADTWATEIGAFSRRPTRLLTTRRIVPAGTSGGITRRGTVGGLVGAAAMGGMAHLTGTSVRTASAAVGGGVLGMFVDSLLGATVQARYRCGACDVVTEARRHCGRTAHRVAGWSWLDNDAVNLAASGAGGLAALASWTMLG